MPACKTCEADDRDKQEEVALDAANGRISWREAARTLGLGHHQSLKNHMERHYTGLISQDPTEQVQFLIEENIKELQEQLAVAPPEIKPFFFMIIHNLRGLAGTKPSQQNLNAALKAIHEVVGMKTQNRLMMDFAMAAFKKSEAEAIALVATNHPPVLELVPMFDDDFDGDGSYGSEGHEEVSE